MADMNALVHIKDENGNVNNIFPATKIANVEGLQTALNTKANSSDVTSGLAGKVDKETGKGLSTNDYTTAEKNKLAGIAAGATAVTVDSTLSGSSTNAIQNKAVTNALSAKFDAANVSTSVPASPTNSTVPSMKLVDDTYSKEIAYERGVTTSDYSERKVTNDGFANFSKKTYGTYENATVLSAIANKDHPTPQVLGANTQRLATYTNRDSVAFYAENTSNGAMLELNNVNYTANTAILPNGTDMSNIKVGMIVDVGTRADVNTNWFVGIISSISGTTLTMEDGWYLVRNDGVTPTKGTPPNGLICRINDNSKIWVANMNMFVEDGCPAGTAMEIGVFANTSNINDVGALDIINFNKGIHYGLRIRTINENFNVGILANIDNEAYVNESTNKNAKLVKGVTVVNSNREEFYICNDGRISKNVKNLDALTSSVSVTNNGNMYLINQSGIGITLPEASGNGGRVIDFYAFKSGAVLQARSGNNIVPKVGSSVTSLPITFDTESDVRSKFVRVFSDGGSTWFVAIEN